LASWHGKVEHRFHDLQAGHDLERSHAVEGRHARVEDERDGLGVHEATSAGVVVGRTSKMNIIPLGTARAAGTELEPHRRQVQAFDRLADGGAFFRQLHKRRADETRSRWSGVQIGAGHVSTSIAVAS
jgi:hypothetical protein